MTLEKQNVNLKYDFVPQRKASKHLAILTLVLAFSSFIPLFNYFLAPIALFLSIVGLKKVKTLPSRYSGKSIFIIALIISLFITLVNILDLLYFRWL